MMSRPPLSRPKTSGGLPRLRSSREQQQQQPSAAAAEEPRQRGLRDSDSRSTLSSSVLRLPPIASMAPHLSRRARLWTLPPPLDRPLEFIGEGAFGRVFKANFKGRPVAVKEVGEAPNRLRRRLGVGDSPDHDYRRELRGAKFLLGLRHVNVVQYLQFDVSEAGRLYVVMELVVGRNLTELRQLQGPLGEDELRWVLAQVCRGLHYLHSHRPTIVHRDVKGSNIMLTESDRVAKLVDLGLAILCDDADDNNNNNVGDDNDGDGDGDGGGTRRSLAGTHRFMAPEVYERQAYSAKSDVYALGCTVFELLQGKPPHANLTNGMQVCYAVIYQDMPDLPAGCDCHLDDLYARCTGKEPEMRPTASELLKHPYLVGAS